VENEFPSNRKAAPMPAQDEKKVTKIVDGRVIRRKAPLGKRFAQLFVAGDSRTVSQYVFMDVILPALKDLVTDTVTTSVERMIFGESRGPSRRPGGVSNYVSYNRFAQPASSTPRPGMAPRDHNPAGRTISRQAKAEHNTDEIILDSRHAAEEVLASLFDLMTKYETVSIADLYDFVGIERNFADEKWGWTDLTGASVSRTRDGYLLNLPRTVEL
jgi:hypothetical protein